MRAKRLRLLIGILAHSMGNLLAVFTKDLFPPHSAARYGAVAVGFSISLAGLLLVLFHLKAEKKF